MAGHRGRRCPSHRSRSEGHASSRSPALGMTAAPPCTTTMPESNPGSSFSRRRRRIGRCGFARRRPRSLARVPGRLDERHVPDLKPNASRSRRHARCPGSAIPPKSNCGDGHGTRATPEPSRRSTPGCLPPPHRHQSCGPTASRAGDGCKSGVARHLPLQARPHDRPLRLGTSELSRRQPLFSHHQKETSAHDRSIKHVRQYR